MDLHNALWVLKIIEMKEIQEEVHKKKFIVCVIC